MTTQFINVIQNVGFPMAAFWLVWRYMTVTNKQNNMIIIETLTENTRAIRDLTVAIARNQ